MKKIYYLLLVVVLCATFNLTLSAQTAEFLGMTQYGGSAGFGTIFKISPDGSTFDVLHDFNYGDGAYGEGSLLKSSNGLIYGVTPNGGNFGIGTIFKMKADGTGFTTLHHFDNTTGRYIFGTLIEGFDGWLYGMTYTGGFLYGGVIFKMKMDGTGFTLIHQFNNTDGGTPYGSLVQTADGKLYGICLGQKPGIFKINTDGTGYTIIFELGAYRSFGSPILGMDGALYILAAFGPASHGSVLKVNTDGSGFTVVHDLAGLEGSDPQSSLIQLPDGSLAGTAYQGGSTSRGTIFKVNPDGSAPTLLHSFTGNDGSHPIGDLTYHNNALYGTTTEGGLYSSGVIFKYDLTSGVFTKLKDLNNDSGTIPWHGALLFLDEPVNAVTPTLPAAAIAFSSVTSSSMVVSFSPGNGSRHLAVMKAGSAPSFHPVDNTSYAGDLGNGESVVYNGTESLFVLNGLAADTEYFITIFEYNEDNNTIDYLNNNAPTASDFTHRLDEVQSYVIKPAANASYVPQDIYMTALEIPFATSYTIEINTDPSFGTSTAITKTGARTLSFDNLQMNTTYYNRVMTNVTHWGDTRQFTTGDGLTLACVVSPSNNAMNVSWEPVIKLNDVGAATYTIQLSDSFFFDSNIIELSGNTTTFNVTGLQQNTKYYARVMTDLNPHSWGPMRAFTTGNPLSLAYVVNPRDEATGISTTRYLTANTIPGATQYIVQLSEQSDFSTIAFELTGSTGNLSFSGLKYNTTYYNRVRTDLSPDFGRVQHFTTRTPESIAFVTSPPNNAYNVKIHNLSIVSKPVPGASWYKIQLSESPDFESIVFEGTSTTHAVWFDGWLNFGTRYYARVLTDLASDYGDVTSFITKTGFTGRMATIQNDIVLETTAYPNPFRESLHLYIESAVDERATVTLRNMTGQTMHESSEQTNTDVEIKTMLAGGTYMLIVNTGTMQKIIKVVKVQ